MKQEPGKRIVSKGEYVAAKTYAFTLSGATILCGLAIALLLLALPICWGIDTHESDILVSLFLCASFTCVFCLPILLLIGIWLLRGSRKSWKTVRTMQPINYANTAELPAADSLVRASQEPLQAQQTVLLRAARETTEGQEDELLRASGGLE